MDIATVRNERQRWFEWKNIAPIKASLDALPRYETTLKIDDCITLTSGDEVDLKLIRECATLMKPWRKGPFNLFGLLIDSEWQSFKKYNLISEYLNLEGKKVADIGCNNGYYMFRMLEKNPEKLVGFDPSPLFACQFELIERYVQSGIVYELLGVEHLLDYEERFDVLVCMGVLYHRSDPIGTLKSLYKGLEKGGEVIIDSFIIEGENEICLFPRSKYSKIPNVYFIPTVECLKNWAYRVGFESVELLVTVATDSSEQRKTEWIDGESLGDFLDPNDASKTVEGYPAPLRGYFKLIKG